MAEITWFGHACFRVRGREAVILMDPVGPSSGYPLPEQSANVVTISHHHPNHSALESIRPGYRLVEGPGEYEIAGAFITGVHTYHDKEQGASLGRNTVYLLEIDDLVICHLGDLGGPLTEEQSAQISAVDVLLVPVGGGPTIDAAAAVEVIGQIEPSIVIPMQYATAQGDHDRDSLETFLKQVGSPDVEPQPRLTVRKSDLSETMQVVVLQPSER